MAIRRALVGLVFLVTPIGLAVGQESLGPVTVRVTTENRPVPGATVSAGTVRTVTDRGGVASLSLPLGGRLIVVTKLGFAPDTSRVDVSRERTDVAVALHEAPAPLGGVVISATRNERRVANEPTRVEVTDREDVEEQIAGSPGVIAELLTESGGVRVQSTSPGSSGTTVRVRGMRGRYTKILSDGLPLFGVTTEGLGPLQIPPLDLHSVEVIKGMASALYGSAALGGVVNLISEQPTARPEFVVNLTSRNAQEAVLWQTGMLDPHWGYTLVAGAHHQQVNDGDADGWADIAGYRRAVVRPRLFWSGDDGNSWFLTGGYTNESRDGGTVGAGHLPNGQTFRDDADTQRGDGGTVARIRLGPDALLALRGSATRELRTRWLGTDEEHDRRTALFSEASLTLTRGPQVLVAGTAVERDAFSTRELPQHDYAFVVPALFAEHTWSPVTWFGLSSSARLDFHSQYGDFVSPRVSALFRPGDQWSVRIAGGGGLFAPTPFTEETEAIGLARLRPITNLGVERGRGVSVDVGGVIGTLELNASAHASVVEHPVAFRAVVGSTTDVELVNALEPTRTHGVEVFAKYVLDPIHIHASYTWIDATELDVERGARRTVPLNPRHGAGLSAAYEKENDTRAGLEFYYTGRQSLADNPYRTVSKPYVTIDALLQQRIGRVIAFVHGEDLNGVRQTAFDPILRPSAGAGGRRTTDVWAPLEGRVVNFGVRLPY